MANAHIGKQNDYYMDQLEILLNQVETQHFALFFSFPEVSFRFFFFGALFTMDLHFY